MKIQEIWNGNGDQFLRWLSDQANLAILNELVGLSLQLESYQQDSAGGSAYLLCKDQRTNYWVLVEHPVGETMEAQLGRLLVDASRYSPVHALWLTGEFSPELRSVINWVNAVTDETLNLFGLEVEFWRIGDSAYAPHFNLALQPPDWEQPVRPQATDQTPRHAPVPAAQPAPPSEPPVQQSWQERDGREARRSPGLFAERSAPEQPAHEPWDEPVPAPEPSRPEPAPNLREAPPPPNPNSPETPSGMLRRAAAEEKEDAPSGMLRRWQESDTTVTPSGMLQRLKVPRDDSSSQGMMPEGSARPLSPAEQLYLDFWTRFWEDVVRWEDELPPERAMSQGWVTFPVGRESFYLVAFVNAEHNLAGMGLVMEGPQSALHFDELSQDRDQIERDIGAVLDWRMLPDKDESHIYLHKRDVNVADRSRWIEYQQWFAETLETFVQVLGNRVQELPPQNHRSGEPVFRQE